VNRKIPDVEFTYRVVQFGNSVGFKQRRFFPDDLDWVVSDLLLELALTPGDNP
jgi:hypothetical protein